MSWPQWQQPPPPQPTAPPVLNPATVTAPIINAAPTVVPPAIQYTPEQWTQLQQQNWHQWAQWQQQYQQWHQQYGAEYQKSLSALTTQSQQNAIPALPPNLGVPPPLPVESKPPLPLDDPPPAQNHNFNSLPPNYNTSSSNKSNWTQFNNNNNINNSSSSSQSHRYEHSSKRRYEQDDYNSKRQFNQPPPQFGNQQQQQQQQQTQKIYQPIKDNPDELSEAEKKFDKQFAEWEAQFNNWKEQNAEHPDKEQFKEYEKKWEQWRTQLLERREQMKKKRLESYKVRQQQNYNPPPPKFGINKQSGLLPTPEPFSRPPPNLNDEPLNFKRNDSNDFLKPSSSDDGIPGLDLVKDCCDVKKEEDVVVVLENSPEKKVPDFDAISKGINSILGDQKLLNMLSIVSSQQNLMKNPDNLVNTISRIKETSNTEKLTNLNDQSNQSHEEQQSNHSLDYNQREFVNNFDDQTRSSFTYSEQQYEGGSNNFRNQFPNRFSNNFENKQQQQNLNRGTFNNLDDRQFAAGPNDKSFDRCSAQFSTHPVERFSTRDNRQMGGQNERFCGGDNRFFNDNRMYGSDNRQFGSDNSRQFVDGGGNSKFDRFGPICGMGNSGGFNNNHSNREDFSRTGFHDDNSNYNDSYYQPEEDENYEDIEHYGETENYEDIEENVENIPPTLHPEDDILKPATVIDYDHKSLRPVEPEILLEPIHMFDYRHKPLSRIPLPQRPKWLSETLKNIHEFDPPVVRPYENLRRYPPPPGAVDSWTSHNNRRSFNERTPFDDRRPPLSSSSSSLQFEDRRLTFEQKFDDRKQRSSDEFKRSFYDERKSRSIEGRNQNEEHRKSHDHIANKSIVSSHKSIVSIEDIISPPGRFNRPPRIVIILRGPPGSGKTFLAKLIKDKEVENGGSAPRILSLDDYFMVEQEKETIEDGKKVKIKDMVYEYEAEMEENYRCSLIKSFKKTITDGYFNFIIVDNVNDKVKYFGEMWSFAKQNGFQVYICQMDLDVQLCTKRNIHGRSEADIEKCILNWEPTPSHHPQLDATSLIQSGSISEVEMEEVNSPESQCHDDDVDDDDDDDSDGQEDQIARSKWDNFDCSIDNLAKLDGVSKPLRPSRTMEEYLQLDTEWIVSKPFRPGQKRVRWADLEEQKQQEKMRAIGFVVGQTDWGRMMDPSMGSSALTQTKYIERVGRY